jgi:hypothetical protein
VKGVSAKPGIADAAIAGMIQCGNAEFVVNLGQISEDDVIEAFKAGLWSFMQVEGGRFGSRRVTLRQEKVFPSDLDMALWFTVSSARSAFISFPLILRELNRLSRVLPNSLVRHVFLARYGAGPAKAALRGEWPGDLYSEL